MKTLNLLLASLLLVFASACAPSAPDLAETQSADVVEASESAEEDHDGEEHDDNEDHDDEDHGDEDHDDDGERRELGAHEHGAAELMIAWAGSDVAIDLETPSYNLLGFEYEPNTDEEKALLAESIAMLESGDLLQISPDAGCTIVSVNVQTAFGEGDHDEEGHDEDEEGHDEDEEGHDEDEEGHDEDKEGDHDEEGHDEEGHDDHDEETHSDIDVSYNLECGQPENIASLDASGLFAQFPNFEDIDVQWVSDTQASAAELTPDNPILELE